MDLKAYLLKNVTAEQFFRAEVEGFEPNTNIVCPFHDDHTPSLGVNLEKNGAFLCYTCGARGTSWIGFFAKREGLDDDFDEALHRLYAMFVRPLVPDHEVEGWHATLLDTPSILEWLEKKRGINLDTVIRYKLGFDGIRVTIPIYNEWGRCINVRRYHGSPPPGSPKITSYDKGYGGAFLYPMASVNRSLPVHVFEGEFDTLLARQLGINAITSTGGAGGGHDQLRQYLAGCEVVLCFDEDSAGRSASQGLANDLVDSGSRVRVVELQTGIDGGDFTDFIVKLGRKSSDYRRLVEDAEVREGDKRSDDSGLAEGLEHVSLQSSDSPKYFGKRISVSGHVVGKDIRPYDVPTRVTITCQTKPDKPCQFCTENGGFTGDVEFDPKDPDILQFIGITDEQRNARIKRHAKCSNRCHVKLDIHEVAAVEDVTVVPELDEHAEGTNYVLRKAFVLGRGLQSNSSYLFTGKQVPDPKTQHVTYLFDESEPAYDSIESFELTGEVRAELEQFQSTDIEQSQAARYDYYANYVTQIYGRRDLHEAIDLVYFSPIGFTFNQRPLRKGWLEALVVGDTRTGKGYVAEGLQRYYSIGEVASSENCSFAGLVGGMQQVGTGRSWTITWGIIPRNDRRMVILDEVSSLSLDDIARMSRIRSEGVAEIVKIHAERTYARTRLVWLGNPRDERQIKRHEYGVEAVKTLIGKSEDIARFDYAMVVAHDDVPSDIINRVHQSTNGSREIYEARRKANKDLVLWVWSREPSQVIFTKEATTAVMRLIPYFSNRYSSSIPLVQSENVGEKIAKVAAAVAGRTYSTDETGENLVVTPDCVKYAAKFLLRIYDAKNMGYDIYSRLDKNTETMANRSDTARLFSTFGTRVPYIIEMMMRRRTFSMIDIQQIFDLDPVSARETVNHLVQQRVLKSDGGRLVKTADAIRWFQEKYHSLQEQLSRTRSE